MRAWQTFLETRRGCLARSCVAALALLQYIGPSAGCQGMIPPLTLRPEDLRRYDVVVVAKIDTVTEVNPLSVWGPSFSFTAHVNQTLKGDLKRGANISGRTSVQRYGCPVYVSPKETWLLFLHGDPGSLTLGWDDATNVNLRDERASRYLKDVREYRRAGQLKGSRSER
jgi:hypothetical protein